MKISILIILVMLSFVLPACLWADDGIIIYSEDFSSNPGWITNNSAHFYWDQAGGRYYYKLINATNEYAYYLLNLMDRGFELAYDVLPTRTGWAAGFRLGASNVNMSDGAPTSTVGNFCETDAGHHIYIRGCDNLGRVFDNFHGPEELFTDGVIYHVILTCDKLTQAVSMSVIDKTTGNSVYFATITGYGPFTGMDRIFMSSIGYPQYPGCYAEGYIDNVVVTVNPSGVNCDPQANFDHEYSLDDCTIALWHLNEGSGGTAHDASNNHIDGTIYGASWTSQGKFNGRLGE